ncbi:hypothetical protein PZQ55_001062 [Clostridium botulinum]|nr:hypothetical protein [Clostridium sporogenes]EKO1912030.1 hypothetical protein [Clostridium botulinum]EKO2042091.1 hypothetical protein [Clostridium botulinum]SUY62291.1 Uncharacterised protein [Clostridium sporogenes]
MGKFIKNEDLKTAEEMLTVLSGDDYNNAYGFHQFGQSFRCVIEPKIGACYYSVKYGVKKPKRALFTMEFTEDKFRVKANLYHFDMYRDIGKQCSDKIKESIKSTRNCTRCNPRCIQGSSFQLDGENYFTCIGSGHFFKNMAEKDWNVLKELLKQENAIISGS